VDLVVEFDFAEICSVRFVRTFFRPLIDRAKFFDREFREYFRARNVWNREWTLIASSFGIRFPFWTS